MVYFMSRTASSWEYRLHAVRMVGEIWGKRNVLLMYESWIKKKGTFFLLNNKQMQE